MIKIKVAVLSDIHGNIVALDAILDELKDEKIDKYIVCGDLVNELPFGNEVIDRLKELNAIAVKGNKEQYLIDYEEVQDIWNNIQFKNTKYMHDELTKENLDYLKSLPYELDLDIEGFKVNVIHGTKDSLTEIVRIEDIDRVDELTKRTNADLILCGHTHDPIWHMEMNGTIYWNCGCVGMSPFNARQAEYTVVNFEDGSFNIEKRIVEFDVEKIIEKLRTCDILKYDRTFMNLMVLVVSGRPDVRKKFFTEGMEIMSTRGGSVYRDDVPEIYRQFKLFDDDVWIDLSKKYGFEFLI